MPTLPPDGARALAASGRVARLATSGSRPGIGLVPCTFALVGETFVTGVDHKPKSTTDLRRLADVRASPWACALIDHYDDERWDHLWWVRIEGPARVVEDGAEHRRAVQALADRYRQYRELPLEGPVIVVDVERWSGWSALG